MPDNDQTPVNREDLSLRQGDEADAEWIEQSLIDTIKITVGTRAEEPEVKGAVERAAGRILDHYGSPNADPSEVYVVFDPTTGERAAFVWMAAPTEKNRGAMVLNLFVEPRWRRQGIATKLVSFAEEWSRRHGAVAVGLGVGAANLPAVALYEKMGYAVSGVRVLRQISDETIGPAPGVSIEPARPDEWPMLLDGLTQCSWSNLTAGERDDLSPLALRQGAAHQLEALLGPKDTEAGPRGVILACRDRADDGKGHVITGFILAGPGADPYTGQAQADLRAVWVDPGRRRQGLATALVAAAEEWAVACGVTHVSGAYGPDNKAAAGLCAALGYSPSAFGMTKSFEVPDQPTGCGPLGIDPAPRR